MFNEGGARKCTVQPKERNGWEDGMGRNGEEMEGMGKDGEEMEGERREGNGWEGMGCGRGEEREKKKREGER